MPLLLKDVLIWSRSYDEYVKFFSLTSEDLGNKILSCADGAASFNSVATEHGASVVSCDPLYSNSVSVIKEKIDSSCDVIFPKIVDAVDDFNWDYTKTPNDLKMQRMRAAKHFLDDYISDKAKTRYVPGELPMLPFENASFDLVLCSNFLFLYSDLLTTEFHISSVRELCRVAKEVRIFPLIGNNRKKSRHIDGVLGYLEQNNYEYSIDLVDYHFTKNANQMLRIYVK